MDANEKNEVDKLVETNFSAARRKAQAATKGGHCMCSPSDCSCPGGGGGSNVGAAANVVGYAGGYAGSLAYQSGWTD